MPSFRTVRLLLFIGGTAGLPALIGCSAGASPGTRAQREAACAISIACFGNSSGFSQCVGQPGLPLTQEQACLARANGSCDAALACAGIEIRLGDCGAAEDRCDGATIVECFPGDGEVLAHSERRPCPAGSRCVVDFGYASCESDCMADSCDGTDLLQCFGSGVQRMQCPFGTACAIRESGRGACEPSGPECGDHRCEGDRLIYCGDVNREYPAIDCAHWDLRCGSDGSQLNCVASTIECDAEEDDARCESGDIVYCGQDARWHRFDCTAHGFMGCGAGRAGDPYCVPTASFLRGS